MTEGMLRPDEFDQEPLIDPNQVAEAAALEDPQTNQSDSVTAADMQEDTHHSVTDQVADDSVALDSETEARLEELRNRGRVGVLTEGTERPDTSGRMKNSDHDPEAIATVNKANRLTRQKREEHADGFYAPRAHAGETFRRTTDRKLNAIAEDDNLKKSFEDPVAWEAGLRSGLEDLGHSDDAIESDIDRMKTVRDRNLERIEEEADSWRADLLQDGYNTLRGETTRQDQYRGDLLDLYARNPEKYKVMLTEEFVAEGRRFKDDSQETSRLAMLESVGTALEKKLAKLVEDTTDLDHFCTEINRIVSGVHASMNNGQLDEEDAFGLVEAFEGVEVPGRETLPDSDDTPEQRAATEAFYAGQDIREGTKRRLFGRTNGYFSASDFVKDLERSPREQMKEAVDRANVYFDKWIEEGQKAREEFDENWGDQPAEEELETESA